MEGIELILSTISIKNQLPLDDPPNTLNMAHPSRQNVNSKNANKFPISTLTADVP
jgi:hypothetical protein